MIPISLVTEDQLSESLARRILAASSKQFGITASFPDTSRRSFAAGSSYIEQRISGFNQAANHVPFFVVLDLDMRECAAGYVARLLPNGPTRYMVLRIAVTEAESWVLADRDAFADYFSVAPERVPRNPDQLSDAKESLFRVIGSSRSRKIREAILPSGPTTSHGPDYNGTLIRFLHEAWRIDVAGSSSPSLAGARVAIDRLSYG